MVSQLPLGLPLDKLLKFVSLCQTSRPTIELGLPNTDNPPEHLPTNIALVIAGVMGENLEKIQSFWGCFKHELWQMSTSPQTLSEEDVRAYNIQALPRGTSYRHLYPPVRVCKTPGCDNYRFSNNIKTLAEPVTYKATLFTLREGSLPVYTTSLYCRGCNKRYHHNYSVHSQSSSRAYYGGVPEYVQVAQHFFLESALLEFFATGKVFGWLSSMNCARIYNISMGSRFAHIVNNKAAYLHTFNLYDHCSLEWQTSLELQDQYVMNGFLLYSLLLEKSERGTTLLLSHNESSQRDRLHNALKERNKQMEGTGQEGYLHACDLCFLVYSDQETGCQMKMQAAVCDGDTIGHPCCAIHDCKNPLVNHQHRFCAEHANLNLQCAVTDCALAREEGFRTCADISHRSLETSYYKRGKALFQLRARLKKAGVVTPVDSVPTDVVTDDQQSVGDEEVIVEAEKVEDCAGKPDSGNRKLRAYFGRRRTHNEQIIIRPCGIILSRATFYGSEAISSVNAFARATFPTPQSTPEFFIFDNNCKLDAHQRVIGDDHFKDTAKPVDVFHFRTKHKLTDTHCQRYCNPAAFPELLKNGQWVFNTSICEQTNVWLGGYQAIVRDMEATRFNFYLDEMIKRRNRYVLKQLTLQGRCPWTVPVHTVFPPAH